jgi:catalase
MRLFANTARAMVGVPEEIKLRWVRLCTKADADYGSGLAKQLGIDPSNSLRAPLSNFSAARR